MTKLDRLIERLRALPEDEQNRLAAEIDFLIDHPEYVEPILTPEQEAELRRRLADPNPVLIPHEEVVTFMEKKYGK